MNLVLPRGEILGLLGKNGSGKTTTIKMICGLLLPSQGEVSVLGENPHASKKPMRQIGAVLEGSRNIYWRLSAAQNLRYFGLLKGLSSSEIKLRSEKLLKELNLYDQRFAPVNTFSRGMKQKVAIAVALLSKPKLLLLDEPVLGLDIEASHAIVEKIKRLVQDERVSVVITSHSMSLVESLAHKIAIIHDGEIVANDTIENMRDRLNKSDVMDIEMSSGLQTDHLEQIMTQLNLELVATSFGISWTAPSQEKLPNLIQMLTTFGYEIQSISARQLSLEDVFLQHTTS